MKKTKDFQNLKVEYEKIDPSLLIAMPYEYKGKKIEINIEMDEFTCLCPWSGLPDFAHLKISYEPAGKLIELKSLKYYLNSYRMIGIVHENAVNRMLKDLAAAVGPKTMQVQLVFNIRGGIKTTVTAEYKGK